MKSRGCSWEGELGRLNNHLSVSGGDCMYIDVSCSYSCGVSMERRYLTAHCENDCFKRPSVCQYCNFEAMYFEICSEHSFFCSDFPVPCPNSCSIGTVERKNLEKHRATCPLASVSCEFEHAGCLEKVKRQDLPSHMELNIQHHLTLLSSLNLRLATSLSEKAVKVAKLEEQIVELETDRISQEEINSQQTEKLEALEEQVEKFKQDRISHTKRIRKMDKRITKFQQTEQRMLKFQHEDTPVAPFQFTIKEFDAFSGSKELINPESFKSKEPFISPAFYTAPLGCLMQVRCAISLLKPPQFQYGYKVLELHVEHLPGKFDECQQWPVLCTVTLSIFNPLSSRSLRSGAICLQLNKPEGGHTSNYNNSAILDQFRLSNITNNFVNNDSVLIRVKVETV